jgi:hypothetical protein
MAKKSLQERLAELKSKQETEVDEDEAYDQDEPVVDEKPKKKGGWVGILGWTILILVAFGVSYLVYDWQMPKVTKVTMTQPVNDSSVQGPIPLLRFSMDRGTDVKKEVTEFEVTKNGFTQEGAFSVLKGKVKTFSWEPKEPLTAGSYFVEVNGDKIDYDTFYFTVTDPEVKEVPLQEPIQPVNPIQVVPAEKSATATSVPSDGVKASDYDKVQ